MSPNEFSVTQFFQNGSYEKVRSFVSAEEAIKAFHHYTTNVASRMGLTSRVIITDGGDSIALEWRHRRGITFGLDNLMGRRDQAKLDLFSKEPTDD
jgi:hypothetical protein